MVFASAATNERSWEDDQYKQGIFTHFLIKGLQGDADSVIGPPDHKITAGKLKAYLGREVPKRAEEVRRPAQTPVVSTEFKSDYVLALAGNESTNASLGDRSNALTAQIIKLRDRDPELALMVHLAATESNLAPFGPDQNVMDGHLRESLDRARVVKTAIIKRRLSPDTLLGYAISSDGTLLVACIEPSDLLAISLDTGEVKAVSPMALPGGQRQGHLDSCTVSVSSDNRLAIVTLKTDAGSSALSLVALDKTPPPFSVESYDAGAFIDGLLCLAKGKALTLVSIDTWSAVLRRDLANPITALLSEPTSDLIGLVSGRNTELYHLNRAAPSLGLITSVPGINNCVVTKDLLICEGGGQWRALGSGGAFSSYQQCEGMACRLFASGAALSSGGWLAMSQGISEHNVIRLVKANVSTLDLSTSDVLHIPERVLTGRLASDGRITLVGRDGGVYRFNGLPYVDCCAVPVPTRRAIAHLAVGSNGFVAVLGSEGSKARLEIIAANAPTRQVELPDAEWVQEIAVGDSNHLIALAGDGKLRMLEFADENAKEPTPHEFDCGSPFALSPTSPMLVCTAAENGGLQLREARTGRIKRVLAEHTRAAHRVVISDDFIGAASRYSTRGLTMVTLWNAHDGKLISHQTCTFDSSEGAKPLAFLRGGRYFAQLETPTRLTLLDAMTCETKNSTPVYPKFTGIQTAGTGDVVVLEGDQRDRLQVGHPFEQGMGLWPLFVGSPVDTFSPAPDGEILVATSGRVLKIPGNHAGLLDLVRSTVKREFTKLECDEFFPSMPCPKLLQ